MKWKLSAAAAVAICAGLLAVLAKGFGRDPHKVPFMLIGKPAPGFALAKLDGGGTVASAQLRGYPVVINFWATWCGPCREEHPVLDWGFRQYGTQVQFLGVLFEDTSENARVYLSKTGSPFPQLADPNSQTAVDYGVAGVPETYFIDAQGMIRGKHVGPIDPDTLSGRVKELLQPVAQVPR